MNTPLTTIDPRYGQSDAAPIGWEETIAALVDAEIFWLTTVRGDGRPHVTPLVAVWFEDALHFCSGAEEQKTVNLHSNPHVVLTTGRDDWNEGIDIVLEGVALQQHDNAELSRLAAAWTPKWDGRWDYEVRDGTFFHPNSDGAIPVFSVKPSKVLVFSRGTFSQTRHAFS